MKSNLLSLLPAFAAAVLGAVSFLPIAARASSSVEAVRLRVEMDRPVLPAGRTERAVVKIALDGTRLAKVEQRAPLNLTLVLDRSGSMSGDKIENAKAAALEAVRHLAADDVFSLVIFDHEVETLIPAMRVGDGRTAEYRIRSISARGNTAIYAGVTQGVAELRKNLEDRRYTHRLILLSDGMANKGPSTPDDFARLGQALLRERISVSTIGLGLDYNEDLMTRLAGKSDGNTYFVSSSRDLTSIFNAELGDVLNVVARRVIVTIDFPAGVRPLEFVGREGSIRGQTAVFELNQLYGGQEKFALVEVEVSSARAGEERELAKATVVFEDAATHRSVNVVASSSARFTTVEAEVVAAANRQVQTDYAVNVTAVAKDRAVVLVDSGRRDDAARTLRERNAELEKMAKTYTNTSVLEITSANTMEAARLERDGLDNVQRKTYRAESTQRYNQQSSSPFSSAARP
jgi:Ca-activated chloride channel family protein